VLLIINCYTIMVVSYVCNCLPPCQLVSRSTNTCCVLIGIGPFRQLIRSETRNSRTVYLLVLYGLLNLVFG